jgi:hypothetical protein
VNTRTFLYLAAASVCAASAICHTSSAHADDQPNPLAGSTEALVMGPTGYPTPDGAYLSAADRLYLEPLGFDGNTIALTTPETSSFGPSVAEGEQDLVNAVEADYAAGGFGPDDPLTIMGYSQSSVIASLAEPVLAKDGIPSDALRFVLIGDTSSAEGGFLNTFGDTPTGIQILDMLGDQNLVDATTPDNLYPTDVYTIDGDGWAQWDNGANLFGMFSTHLEYLGVTAADVAGATETVDGMTDYYTIANPGVDSLEVLINAAAAS